MWIPRVAAVVVVVLSLVAGAPAAERPLEPEGQNRVDLTAEASREMPNDTIDATLFAEVTDSSPAAVASQLNRTLNDALKQVQPESLVTSRSGGMTSSPVYAPGSSGKLTGWRGRAELRLESHDARAIGEAIGKLQALLLVGSISYTVSPDVRRRAENELITQAIEAFRSRADVVRQALGGKGVRIRHLSVSSNNAGPPPRPMMMRAAGLSSSSVEPPAIEAGGTTVQVVVTGTVEVE